MKKILAHSHFKLRLIQKEDVSEFYKLIDGNRIYLKAWLSWVDSMSSVSVAEKYIESRIKLALEKKGFCFAILVQNKIAGLIHLVDIDTVHKNAMIGYWIAEAYKGQGLTTNATQAVVRFAFEELKLHRIEVRCATGNLASSAIPKKLGFHHEGVIRDGEWLHDRFVDQNLFSLLSNRN